MDDEARYTLRVERELLSKFKYVVKYEGRSINSALTLHMKRRIKTFEEENGEIVIQPDKDSAK